VRLVAFLQQERQIQMPVKIDARQFVRFLPAQDVHIFAEFFYGCDQFLIGLTYFDNVGSL